jgi:hypothetical protein
MDAPQYQYHQENLEESKKQLEATQSSGFFKFAENSITYLYILPPWSERGLLARMVKECFLGKGQGRHTCWHTYEMFGQPELGKKDPIVNVLFEAFAARGKPDDIKRKLPNMRWYVNAIVDGVSMLGPNGEEQDNYEASIDPKQVIAGFTDAMWRELDKKRRAPGVGCIYDPSAAICVIVTRDDTGDITKYSIALAGNKVAGAFTPERTNIGQQFEKRKVGGSEKVTEIIASLNNLEDKWPMPGQEAFAEAGRKAEEIKATLLGGAGTAVAGTGTSFGGAVPGPGGFAPPGGAVAPPGVAPQGAPQQQAPPGAVPGQAPQGVPPGAQPQPAGPPATAPGTGQAPPGYQQPGMTGQPPPGYQQPVPTAPQQPAQGTPPGTAAMPGATIPGTTAPGTVGNAGAPPVQPAAPQAPGQVAPQAPGQVAPQAPGQPVAPGFGPPGS